MWGLLGLAAWFLVTFLYFPNLSVIGALFSSSHGNVISVARDLLSSSRVLAAIDDTLIVAGISVVTVSIVGIIQTFLLEAFRLRGRTVLTIAYAVPLVFGSVSAVTGYVMVYGPHGAVTIFLQEIFPSLPADWFSGMGAVIVVHTFTMTGYHFLFLRPAIRRVDFSVVEAARSLGVGVLPAFVRVVLPILRPMIVASLLMVLIAALGSFAAPNILGGGNFTMVGPLIQTLTKLGRPDMAAMLGVFLALVTIAGLIWALREERKANLFSTNKSGQPFRPITVKNPILRVSMHVVAYTFALINLLPLIMTAILSFSPIESIRNDTIGGGLTLEHYIEVFSNPTASKPLINSLMLCLVAIPIAISLGTLLSHFVDRHRSRATDVLQITFFLPYFLPGVLIALGFLIAFGQPTWLLGGQVLIGSFWILPMAYVIILLPTVVRFVRASYANMDPSLDDAARSLGAHSGRRFISVILPVLTPVLLQVAALSFNQTFDEYTISVMLYNVNNQPLGVAMGALAASTDPSLAGVTTAYIVINTVVALAVILFADRMAARSSRRLIGLTGARP